MWLKYKNIYISLELQYIKYVKKTCGIKQL